MSLQTKISLKMCHKVAIFKIKNTHNTNICIFSHLVPIDVKRNLKNELISETKKLAYQLEGENASKT